MNTDQRAYSSIFLDDGWAHQKYFGWKQIAEDAGFRILRKRQFPYTRYLLLLCGGGRERLSRFLVDTPGFWFGDITIHDFDQALQEPLEIGGRKFHRADPSERLLNIATFAIDLTQDEDTILAAISSEYRRKIKKASSLSLVVEVHDKPTPDLLSSFLSKFNAFARTRALKPIDGGALERMYAQGDALLFVVRKQGAISNYLHIYRTGAKAIFMSGVNPSKDNDGAGQLLHWRAIQRLKQMGLEWYDLGGVATTSPSDGIYNFKVKFGGPLVDLGCEWRHAGAVMRALQGVQAKFKEITTPRS
jgi:hypothetical protein